MSISNVELLTVNGNAEGVIARVMRQSAGRLEPFHFRVAERRASVCSFNSQILRFASVRSAA
jgi:hypothetical protein